MSDTPIICGHCRERIHSMSGARHFGHFMAHQESECLSILLAKVAAVTAERDALREAAATLIIRLPERMASILRGMHEDDVIPLHDAIEEVRAALRRP